MLTLGAPRSPAQIVRVYLVLPMVNHTPWAYHEAEDHCSGVRTEPTDADGPTLDGIRMGEGESSCESTLPWAL